MANRCILVCGETRDGILDERTLEMIGAGRELAGKLGVEIAVALLGDDLDGIAEEISFFGADKIYKVVSPSLGTFAPDLWIRALEELCKQIDPQIVLMLHSTTWMDVGPRLAFRLGSETTTDCVGLEIDEKDGLLLKTKPVFGGNALAVFKCEKLPQFVTVRRNVMKPAARLAAQGEIVDFPVNLDPSMLRVESIKTVKEQAVSLEKANVIVAGGRGIGGPEGFKELEDLAESLKQSFDEVMVGCSRPVVDSGWVPADRQIGLSGAMVQPDLYIAVGISGAIQHLVGMARSRTIVAVNTDINSSIFAVADYGVVDDYKRVIPSLKDRWEELCRDGDKDTCLCKANT